MHARHFPLLLVSLLILGCGGDKGLHVTEIEPNRGPYIGGEPTTIHGGGFNATQGVTIYFGGKKAPNPVVESPERISVSPPGGVVDSTVEILIVFADGKQINVPKAYTYVDPLGTAGAGAGGPPTAPTEKK